MNISHPILYNLTFHFYPLYNYVILSFFFLLCYTFDLFYFSITQSYRLISRNLSQNSPCYYIYFFYLQSLYLLLIIIFTFVIIYFPYLLFPPLYLPLFFHELLYFDQLFYISFIFLPCLLHPFQFLYKSYFYIVYNLFYVTPFCFLKCYSLIPSFLFSIIILLCF